ncbi:hypothetical protein [Companilactobacillus baiquanensis]|uniref:Uncharacterized protein n=1 Tax=Companilactobacillus baiquanensis TaxID=2486005 RepID=A0ABW1UWD3_9LACO|nr:hypothetical protein [Companilactobacillus baiquanensis]
MVQPQIKFVSGNSTLDGINKTVDTGKSIFDEDSKMALKILGRDPDGNVIAKKYKLIDTDQTTQLKVPELQDIEGFDGLTVKLDRITSELYGSSMFHSENFNIEKIEKALNLILRDMAIITSNQKSINAYFSAFGNSTGEALVSSLSEMIADEVSDEVGKETSNLSQRLSNIESRLRDSPISNGVHAPSYTGNGQQYSDDDLEVDRKLAEMNSELNKGGDI